MNIEVELGRGWGWGGESPNRLLYTDGGSRIRSSSSYERALFALCELNFMAASANREGSSQCVIGCVCAWGDCSS